MSVVLIPLYVCPQSQSIQAEEGQWEGVLAAAPLAGGILSLSLSIYIGARSIYISLSLCVCVYVQI
jgi:hypothetical protein